MASTLSALEIRKIPEELKSVVGTHGKSNSMKKHSFASPSRVFLKSLVFISGTFLAVRIPDSVKNSITLEFTKPFVKSMCEAANVAWPQSLTCKRELVFCQSELLLFVSNLQIQMRITLN